MLSAENNRLLTEVHPGSRMGGLLRRYWHPIAASAGLETQGVMLVRLLGEDLVLFRSEAGLGLIDRRCPHRGADLSAGYVDGSGLRCAYHGWKFEQSGTCVAQPYEDLFADGSKLRDKASIASYPVRELAGLIWAYLGPQPAPPLPEWEPFTWENFFVQIVFAHIPCNWLQCQENSIDPVHFEWLHENWGALARQGKGGPWAPAHQKLSFDEFEHGFVYRRVREGFDESDELWSIGRVCLWPTGLFIGDHFEWRVPIDNENTLSVTWMFDRVPAEQEPFKQATIPFWTGPTTDPESGEFLVTHILNQDIYAWVGQGKVADRTKELLARSDHGIAMLRRRLLDEMQKVERGEDPKGVVRDPERNHAIELPIAQRDLFLRVPTHDDLRANRRFWAERGIDDPFIYQAGQPAEVRQAYVEAMGVDVYDDSNGG